MNLDIDTTAIANVPHIAEYLGEWAMAENHLFGLCQLAQQINLHAHLASPRPAETAAHARASTVAPRQGKVAVVSLSGTLMKQESSATNSTSTVAARRAIREAANDESVTAILLAIDSPGGTVAGTKELAEEVAAAKAKKPVYAQATDMCASAAYWIASQATKVFANSTAQIGSIGTYGVLQDLSGLAAQKGIKVHVVRAGAMKGAGVPGTEITAEILADQQRIIDQLNEHFLEGVAKGRSLPMETVRALADGRVHVGAEAARLQLIDGVQSIDQTLTQLSALPSRSKPMSQDNSNPAPAAADAPATPKAATIAEIKAACPGAPSDFVVAQLEAGATVQQAQTAFIALQQKQVAELQASAAQPKPKAVAGQGVDPVNAGGNTTDTSTSDPVAEFHAKVGELVAKGTDRLKAVQAVARQHPDLHQAFLLATNHTKKAQREIREKFE